MQDDDNHAEDKQEHDINDDNQRDLRSWVDLESDFPLSFIILHVRDNKEE